jgi:hypothetical protein
VDEAAAALQRVTTKKRIEESLKKAGIHGKHPQVLNGGRQPWWWSLSSPLSSNLRARHHTTERLGLSASFPARPSPARSPWRRRLPGSGPPQLRIHIHGKLLSSPFRPLFPCVCLFIFILPFIQLL